MAERRDCSLTVFFSYESHTFYILLIVSKECTLKLIHTAESQRMYFMFVDTMETPKFLVSMNQEKEFFTCIDFCMKHPG